MLTPAENMELLQLLELDVARNSLEYFTTFTFPDYEVNWHHAAVCRTLDLFFHTEQTALVGVPSPNSWRRPNNTIKSSNKLGESENDHP
jgi:hypothetical protein